MASDLVERLARAWASIDGSAKRFERGRSGSDSEGTYESYMIEAEELLKRSGLADHFTALQARNARLERALLNARDFMEDEYLNSWDCCTPPRTPVSMEPREHKELIDPYSFDDIVKVADLIRATDAALSNETPDTPQDTEDKGDEK